MAKGFSIELASLVGAYRCGGWGKRPCDDVRFPDDSDTSPVYHLGKPIMNLYELLDHIETNAREAVSKYRKRRR